MATVLKRLYSQEEFFDLEAKSQTKHEFYRGEIFAMSGASTAHNRIVLNCLADLYQQLKGQPCQPNTSDVMVKVAATSLLTYPDVSVACPPVERESAPIEVLLNPKVLIEVLSPSTEIYDRNTKFRQYQLISSVEELVLIRQEEAAVEHYHRQPGDVWAMTTLLGLEATLSLPTLGCRLPLAQIYSGVDFPPPVPAANAQPQV